MDKNRNVRRENKIPFGVERERKIKKFVRAATLGFVGDAPREAASYYSDLNGMLELNEMKTFGELWRNLWTNPEQHVALLNYGNEIRARYRPE